MCNGIDAPVSILLVSFACTWVHIVHFLSICLFIWNDIKTVSIVFFFALPFLLLLVRWQLLLCVDGSKSVLSSSHNWDTRNLWICLLREKFIANYTQQLPGNLSFTEQLRKSSECKCVSVCAYVCEHAVCPCIYFNVYKYEIRFCRMRLLRLSFIVVKVLFANGI